MNSIRRTGAAEPPSGLPARAGRRSADVLRGVIVTGNSPGTLSATGATTWGTGGNYIWQIYTVAGGAGSGIGWDLLDSTGSLAITASGGTPFNINQWSLSGLPDVTGNVSDFNAGSSSNFLIAEFDGGITGFDVSKFSVNTAALNGTGGFQNSLDGGMFTIALGDTVSGGNANQIYLVYTPRRPGAGHAHAGRHRPGRGVLGGPPASASLNAVDQSRGCGFSTCT